MGVCVLLLNQLRSRLLLLKTCSAKKHFLLPNIPVIVLYLLTSKKAFFVAKYSRFKLFHITFPLRSSAFEGVSFMVLKMTYIYNNQHEELNLNSTSMQVMMVWYASWHGIRPPNPDNIRYCLLSWMFVLRSLISHYLSTNIMRAIREYSCVFFLRASLSANIL